MRGIVNQIDHSLLDHDPPRPLPPWLIADLLGDRLLERPLRSYLDPLLIAGFVVALALALLDSPLLLSWLVALLLAVRLGMLVWEFLSRALSDMRLLRHGVIVQARVLRVRSSISAGDDPTGAYLDCELPVSRRRTSAGSVWVSPLREAMRLADQGQVQAICLPRAPGTWRLLESRSVEVRYEPPARADGEV